MTAPQNKAEAIGEGLKALGCLIGCIVGIVLLLLFILGLVLSLF
jgi:hypothetical protein